MSVPWYCSTVMLSFTSTISILHWLTQHIGLAVRKWSSSLSDRIEKLMGPRYLLALSKQTRWLRWQIPPCSGIPSFTSILLRGNKLNEFTPKVRYLIKHTFLLQMEEGRLEVEKGGRKKPKLTRGFELADWNYGVSRAVLAASRHKKLWIF